MDIPADDNYRKTFKELVMKKRTIKQEALYYLRCQGCAATDQELLMRPAQGASRIRSCGPQSGSTRHAD